MDGVQGLIYLIALFLKSQIIKKYNFKLLKKIFTI